MKRVNISLSNASRTNNGVFEGWGTSLCWWANRIGFSEKLISDSARLFFSEEGLSLNIMRYNIGGGDDPKHNHIKRTDSEMPGWWKYDESKNDFVFNSDTDRNQLNTLKACYEAAGKLSFVEAFSNSPPYYMTVSGCSSGSKSGVTNNLKKEFIRPFGEYLATVCQYIQNEMNIKIRSLAPMNEPVSNYWKAYSEKQEGCFVSPGKMQSSILIATAQALKEKGLHDIILTSSDETNTVTAYIAAKMLSKEAMNEVRRISVHTYAKATPQIGRLSRELGKNIWMDESDWSGVSGDGSGEMGPALWLSEKIIEDLNTLSPSAWVIWQIVASYISRIPDEKGRLDMPSIPDLTKGFWGTAFADIDNEEICLSQKYYAFGQFTKFIKPGMTIIHPDDKKYIAAFDKKNQKAVIVAVNTKRTSYSISFNLDGFSNEFKTALPIRTSGSLKDGEHWNELSEINITNNSFTADLKENSITTFILS